MAKGTRGNDAAKRINDRKRFIVTDTLGLLMIVMVCAANVQDRDGAKLDSRERWVAAGPGPAPDLVPEIRASEPKLPTSRHRRRSPIDPAVISIQVDVAAADDSDDVTADETITVFQDGSDAEGG